MLSVILRIFQPINSRKFLGFQTFIEIFILKKICWSGIIFDIGGAWVCGYRLAREDEEEGLSEGLWSGNTDELGFRKPCGNREEVCWCDLIEFLICEW